MERKNIECKEDRRTESNHSDVSRTKQTDDNSVDGHRTQLDITLHHTHTEDPKAIEEYQEKDRAASSLNAETTAAIAGGVAGSAAAVATPVALAGVGFGSSGIAAGSIAAGVQSAVYGAFVPAGGVFATATSMGAGGTSLLLLAGPIGLLVGAGAASGAYFWKRSIESSQSVWTETDTRHNWTSLMLTTERDS